MSPTVVDKSAVCCCGCGAAIGVSKHVCLQCNGGVFGQFCFATVTENADSPTSAGFCKSCAGVAPTFAPAVADEENVKDTAAPPFVEDEENVDDAAAPPFVEDEEPFSSDDDAEAEVLHCLQCKIQFFSNEKDSVPNAIAKKRAKWWTK